LAAVVIADELGLVSPAVVNATVLVILLSALIAGVTADRYAPRIEVRQSRTRAIGNRVVVPVAHPRTVTPLVRVAAQLAADDSGAVVAVNVLPLNATDDELRSHRSLAAEAERVALAAGSEVTTSVRIDASTVGGVLHTVAEQGGTALVMGWKGFANRREGFFGSVIDQVVDQSTVPVLVCRPGDDDRTRRVVVVVTEGDVEPGGERGVRLAFEVGSRIARQAEVDLVVFSEVAREAAVPHLTGRGVDDVRVTAVEGLLGQLPSLLRPGDVVLTGMPPRTGRLGRGARRLARAAVGRTVIVVVPH
jgi:nucleotide-binding universal stress UspA family protein